MIVEVLLAAVIIGIVFAGVATLTNSQSRSITSSSDIANVNNQLDADVAAVRNLAETFTWCSGNGGFSGTATNCSGAAARTASYYFPIASATTAITNFETACNNTATDSLNVVLVTAINAIVRPSLITNRDVTNDDIPTNRLRITYTTSPGITRTVILTPTVAAWCP